MSPSVRVYRMWRTLIQDWWNICMLRCDKALNYKLFAMFVIWLHSMYIVLFWHKYFCGSRVSAWWIVDEIWRGCSFHECVMIFISFVDCCQKTTKFAGVGLNLDWISTHSFLIQQAVLKLRQIFHVEFWPLETGSHCITYDPSGG